MNVLFMHAMKIFLHYDFCLFRTKEETNFREYEWKLSIMEILAQTSCAQLTLYPNAGQSHIKSFEEKVSRLGSYDIET